MAITNSTITYDQEKYLAKQLLQRSYLKLVMSSLCDQDQMREGAGLTAYMVRYKRMNTPTATLTEGTTPTTQGTFTLEQVTVTLDQWGDYLTITDVAQLTAKHQVVQEAVKLLADNAARVMDREITIVLLSGTNIQYGDGSVSSRATVTSTMKISDTVLQKARVTMVNNGAPPRGGPAGDARQVAAQGNFQNGVAYVAVCGPELVSDIQQPSTSFGSFVSAAVYANAKALYNAEVGMWLGFRIVETNFLPKFVLLGNKTTAAAEGADCGGTGFTVDVLNGAGTLANSTTFAWKITRKDLLRGFEEAISIIHTTATGAADDTFTFTAPSTSGYVYNVYFDKTSASTTDAGLGLASENVAASGVATILSVATSSTTPPGNLLSGGTSADPSAIYPMFIFGEAAVGWVGFYKPKFLLTGASAEKVDPLAQYRTAGYKFFGKAVIKDQTRLLRLEVASTF